jgi:hypothetical protein
MYGSRRRNEHGLLSVLFSCVTSRTYRALHNGEKFVAPHRGPRRCVDLSNKERGPSLVEAETFDRGFAALNDYVNRASLNVGAGIAAYFVAVVDNVAILPLSGF